MTSLPCRHVFLVVLLIIECCYGFYLPERAPVNYCPKASATDNCSSEIPIFVNRLNSAETLIPFEYDHFDFCQPEVNKSPTENLGQVVFGERIRSSHYKFTFGDSGYGSACDKKYEKGDPDAKKKIEALIQAIRLNYQHHWIIDNMPVSSCYFTEDRKTQTKNICYPSFPVGCYVDKNLKGKDDCHSLLPKDKLTADTAYLFNHVELILEYHRNDKDAAGSTADGASRLVRAQVYRLVSVAHKDSANIEETVRSNQPLTLPRDISASFFIDYTYQVTFKENENVKWSSRWDYILDSIQNANIEWFSIMNSVVVILFLSGLMAMTLLRTVYEDRVWFNVPETVQRIFCSQGNIDPSWMLVQGDVFRPPCVAALLSVFLGSGVQIFSTAMITLVLASVGLLSPANRGGLMTCFLALFVCLGSAAGYVSSRIYKMFGGEKWMQNAILTACICPGIVFAFTFVLDIIFRTVGSSAALPRLTLLSLLALWFGVSVPLTFVGAYFGFKTRAIQHPVHTNEIARTIPNQPLFGKPMICIIMGGVLPFGCILIQLSFILSSIWSHHHLYNMFGVLLLSFVFLVVICSETTILLCYLHLCAEDYRWSWRSFLTSGSTAFYFFLYSIYYYVTNLEMEGFLNAFFYFGYTFIMTFIAFLLTGTVGFFACLWFVRKIYSTINVDNGIFHVQISEKNLMSVDKKEVPFANGVSNDQLSEKYLISVDKKEVPFDNGCSNDQLSEKNLMSVDKKEVHMTLVM